MSDQPEALRLAGALERSVRQTDSDDDVAAVRAECDALRADLTASLAREQDVLKRFAAYQRNAIEEKNLRVAECDALRADAERYRWLRECARATSEHWGGRWSLVIEGPAPGGNAPPASIDAAVDAALKEAK